MPASYPFKACWLAETLRLREAHWGPLEDAAEVRRARSQGGSFTEKILLRARLLAQRENLDTVLEKWTQIARLALTCLLLAAVLTGAGAALGALGDGSHSVNILLALAAMLGLHSLTFLFWLLSFAFKSDGGGVWLGQLWLWLTQKLARGPDAALAPRALIEVLGRNGALRWVLSSISHGVWASAFISLLITLLAMLSVRRYGFNWETTLLSSDTFVHLTAVLGWLPAQLGFATPSSEVVRASNGLQTLPESAQALWSGWLIGCVVVYGLAPRVISLLISLFLARSRLHQLHIDENLPAYASLRERLHPASERIGIDAPDGDEFQARIQTTKPGHTLLSQAVLVGLELPPDRPWPPAPLPSGVQDLGVIDTRAQRTALLDLLQSRPPARLLLVCDGRQTPDRGTVALAADLASIAQQSHVSLLLPARSTPEPRARTWYDRLTAAGFELAQIEVDFDAALAWLNDAPNPEAAHAR
jgi:hypothetical protein